VRSDRRAAEERDWGSLGLLDRRAVLDVVLEVIREVRPLAEVIGRRDSDLAKQLRSALSSVALNIAEASDQRGATSRRRPH